MTKNMHENIISMERSLPVLPRLDRLDRLLELLEENHRKSRMFGSTMTTNDDLIDKKEKVVENSNCRSMLSALNDVHHKGTLIDRLTMLENRVLQLSLDMEEGSTSRSSSSTANATKEDKEVSVDKCLTNSDGKGKRERVPFKWMGWFALRC